MQDHMVNFSRDENYLKKLNWKPRNIKQSNRDRDCLWQGLSVELTQIKEESVNWKMSIEIIQIET